MSYTHIDTNLPIENQYPKLVRDKIPEIITNDGFSVEYHRENDDATYLQYLFTKLLEEATELSRAENKDHQIEELADVNEVLSSLLALLDITESDVSKAQSSKRQERGGFLERIVVDSTGR
ncbi:phosphoribosyl-ATP pyrophosphohydrolase [Candidatus Saccharibacteria bacterium]|nr:phosphoribosyl-ATP pyrophosphohydrolase [Candidatus Saccharibacteria bacterium]